MPADYNSTARALSLPISPPLPPTTSRQPIRAPWTRQQSTQTLLRRQSSSGERGKSLRDNVIDHVERIQRRSLHMVKSLTPLQRVLAGTAILAVLILVILFFLFNESIFAWLEPIAEKWKSMRGGWLIIWALTFITAFPPLIGYSTCLTIAGFVYGFPIGWFIVASATVLGSTCSFIVSRTVLSTFVHRLVANDNRFAALSLVLKHDGLKLLCMIRLCPLPYSISNGAMSTIPTVNALTYALATAIVSPKLMIHIFIGGRLAAIARSGEKMDASTKAINYASIAGGAIVGVATGWFIYQRTLARSREIEAGERANLRQSAQRSGEFSDDPEEQAAAATSLRDDDIDFLDHEESDNQYQDDFNDDDDDVFRHGDGDEEGSIGLDVQLARR
ncbi:Tlg2-vesicle protein [Toensbergia leucococca]|nr:Tlg2-vesicle protein [Toensbergia leucococca]